MATRLPKRKERMRSLFISRGRLVVTALLATLVVVGAAAPAAARSSRTPERLLSSTMASNVWICDYIAPRALCTTTNRRTHLYNGADFRSGTRADLVLQDVVWLHCYARGQSVSGDNVWYFVTREWWSGEPGTFPPRGYVPGFYLNTGPDPHPWVAPCS